MSLISVSDVRKTIFATPRPRPLKITKITRRQHPWSQSLPSLAFCLTADPVGLLSVAGPWHVADIILDLGGHDGRPMAANTQLVTREVVTLLMFVTTTRRLFTAPRQLDCRVRARSGDAGNVHSDRSVYGIPLEPNRNNSRAPHPDWMDRMNRSPCTGLI